MVVWAWNLEAFLIDQKRHSATKRLQGIKYAYWPNLVEGTKNQLSFIHINDED